MFHVKHSGNGLGDPKEIAREARSRVGDYLAGIEYRPTDTGFAERIERFAAMLAIWGSRTNLTAHPEDPAEIAFHIIDSLAPLVLASPQSGSAFAECFRPRRRILDLGSGAGFPGLILAAACDANFTLLEVRHKRASFLRVAAAEMSLGNVTIDDGNVAPATFDVVAGRAFAKPAIFYEAATRHLHAGGYAILFATPEQPLDERAAATAGLTCLRLIPYEVPRGGKTVARIIILWQFS